MRVFLVPLVRLLVVVVWLVLLSTVSAWILPVGSNRPYHRPPTVSSSSFSLVPFGSPRPTTATPGFLLQATTQNDDHDEDPDNAAWNPDTILQVAAALPHEKDQVIVVKYGGNAMTSPSLKQAFCHNVAALQRLGFRLVIVHGGGPQINQLLQQLNVTSTFSPTTGMRISTPEVVQVAELVLSGSVNKELVATIGHYGGRAIGVSGRDHWLLQCTAQDETNLGLVGHVEHVNAQCLHDLLNIGLIPVVSPIGTGIKPTSTTTPHSSNNQEPPTAYNVNADVAAGCIASAMQAQQVIFLTDIAGVLDADGTVLSELNLRQVQTLLDTNVITGGMIRKCISIIYILFVCLFACLFGECWWGRDFVCLYVCGC